MSPQIIGTPDDTPEVTPPPVEEPKPWEEIGGKLDQFGERFGTLEERLNGIEERFSQPAPAPEQPAQEWTPNGWQDVLAKTEEVARNATKAEREAYEAEQKRIVESEAAQKAQIDKMFDEQIGTLETAGKLPKILNEEDPEDPGRLARRELFGYAATLETMNLREAYKTVEKMHAAGFTYDSKAKDWLKTNPSVPGKNAPIGSSSRATSNGTGNRPSAEQIRKLSLDQLAQLYG